MFLNVEMSIPSAAMRGLGGYLVIIQPYSRETKVSLVHDTQGLG